MKRIYLSYFVLVPIVLVIAAIQIKAQEIQPPPQTLEWVKKQYAESQLERAAMIEFAQNLLIENRQLKATIAKQDFELKSLKEKVQP